MKKQVKREEVANLLIKDKFFSKENYWLKVKQWLIAIIGWCGVIFPFVWVEKSFHASMEGKGFQWHSFPEARRTFYFLLFFLAVAFIVFVLLFLLMTRWNNRRYKETLISEKMYDEQKLEKRREILEVEFTRRFGSKEERETICYYVVSKEQNFEKDLIENLYKQEGVEI
ncbi:hypothetical protein [Enterococcus ratti]|uniref:Uncharacterized protein n=1 Tax=Enterococcus ratti TaxID=150033 RepID=A0A1L8WQN0_9ENTE|nr:hypothetical protein [Enterococcus ratti]OJG83307.1 hypothetical protein RV14_GL001665 [Enterococcus ratti]